jgi:hypothetical protein
VTRRWTRRPWLRDAVALGVLAAIWLVFYWRFLPLTPPGDRVMFPAGDFWQHYYLYRAFAFEELRAGRLPLWMSCVFSGYPFQADPQSALLYPSAVLTLGLGLALGWLRFPAGLYQLEALGHVLLGAWLTYAFLRGEVRRRSAALIGATAFGFGGYLTGYLPLQIALLQAAVWLPPSLIAIRRLVATARAGPLLLLALVWALSILAGNPQTYAYVIYAGLAYGGFRLALLGRAHGWRLDLRSPRVAWDSPLTRRALLLGLALVLAVGLCAVQLLPGLEYTRTSTRARLGFDEAGTGFPLADILQLVVPGFVSLWHPLYVGLLPLALAAFAVLAWRRGDRPDVWFWLGVALAGLLLSFGSRVAGYDIAYWLVPGYNLFRSQERHALWVAFALAVLAAYGADRLLGALSRRERRSARTIGLALGVGTLLLFVALGIVTYLKRLGIDPSDSGRLPEHVGLATLVAALAAGLWAWRLRSAPRALVAGAMVALAGFNLISASRGLNAVAQGPLWTADPLLEPVLADPAPYRLQEDFVLADHAVCLSGLDKVWGEASIKPASYARFIERAPEAVRWQLLAVRYVITWRGELVTREGRPAAAERVAARGEGSEYRATYRLGEPRWAWLVHRAETAASEDALYAALAAPDFDAYQTAILRTGALSPGPPPPAAGQVTVRERVPGRFAFDVASSAPGLLVVSETAYPGWVARVDGQAAEVVTVDDVLLGVVVPADTRTVELVFEPPLLASGAALSLTTLGAIGLIGLAATARTRRARRTPAPATPQAAR